MASLPYTVSGNTLTIVLDDPITITSAHPNFQKLLDALRGPEASQQIPDLLDPAKAANRFTDGRITRMSSQRQVDMAERYIAAGFPRMAEALNAFLDDQPPGGFLAAPRFGGPDCPLLHNGSFLLTTGGRDSGRAQAIRNDAETRIDIDLDLYALDDADKLVFEQLLDVSFDDEAELVRFRTSYRTLVVPRARLPFLQPSIGLEITDFNRNITTPSAVLGIEFLRTIATNE